MFCDCEFVYDSNNVVAEYEDGTLTKKYLWGEDVSGSMDGAGGVGALLVVTNDSENYYPSYDGNSNIVNYVDENQTSVASFEYSPFGKLSTNNETIEQPFKFSSEYHDEQTGLVYYNYRYYNPENGKWLKRDPIEEKGGFNLYGFVQNNSVMYIDLLGLSEFMKWQYEQVYGTPYVATDPGKIKRYRLSYTFVQESDSIAEFMKNIYAKRLRTADQLINDIENKFKDSKYNGKCHCIEYIMIHAHAYGGFVRFYDNYYDGIGPNDIASLSYNGLMYFDDKLKSNKLISRTSKTVIEAERIAYKNAMKVLNVIKKYLCKDKATVHFVQCSSSQGGAGKTLKKYLEDFFGKHVDVKMYDVDVRYDRGTVYNADNGEKLYPK